MIEKTILKGVVIIKKLKRILTFAALLAIFLHYHASALDDTERINWFFKQKGDNARPEILGGSSIPEEYGALFMGKEGDKRIYLTFDAGYGNENVEKTLDILKEHNVTGAFFILPGIVKNSPEIVKRMADEGHLVCNHTATHCDISKITDAEALKSELERAENSYRELTGLEMEKFFRPPEGAFSVRSLELCRELGYTPVFWSFAHADWDNSKQPNPEKAKQKILSSAHDGMVILLHPTSATNAAILEDVITELTARGYSFGTLHDLKNSLL